MRRVTLVEEWYEGPVLTRSQVDAPTLQIIASAVDRLNEKRRSLLSLVDDSDPQRMLFIGGGANNVYVAQLCAGIDKSHHRLMRTCGVDQARQELTVGGQAALYSVAQCCARGEIHKAIRWFLNDAQMGDGLQWEPAL